MKMVLMFALLMATVSLHARSLEGFHKRFKLVENSKGDRVIMATNLRENNSLTNYLTHFAKFFDKKTKIYSLKKINCKAVKYDRPKGVNRIFRGFSATTRRLYFDKILENKKLAKAIKKVEATVSEYTNSETYLTMSNLDRQGYFKKNKVVNKIRSKVLSMALSKLDVTGTLKLINHAINDYYNKIQHKKIFYQYTLLYYLSTYSPEQLGMTKDEHAYALSSLAEALQHMKILFGIKVKRIYNSLPWQDQGYEYVKNLKKKKSETRRHFRTHGKVESEESLFFDNVTYKEEGFTVNTLELKGIGKTKSEVAFAPACRDFTYYKRFYHALVETNLELVPIPMPQRIFYKFFKDTPKGTIKEGILYGYYEAHGNKEMLTILKRQALNPLL